MGEQRPRRSGSRTSAAAESIDNSGKSRGLSAAPQPPPSQSRKRHHRKSDRRREHRKVASKTRARNSSTPPPPRVNPIFVWVRQEDTRIVDVKCEDYDKRNRILLTKTPQGWRAIPRTETLAPTLKEAADRRHHHRKHHHHRPHKDKVKKKSTAVQVDGNISNTEEPEEDVVTSQPNSPTWNTPVNVESHLPSHKILVPQKCPSPSVNTVVDDSAQTQTEDNQCSVPKLCDISPLDNLLAVAEFEFNQQNWSSKSTPDSISEDDQKDIINNILQSCQENSDDPTTKQPKSEECDYNEEDENNLAMDDILTRLEQSLQSPECSSEIAQVLQLDQDNKEEEEVKVSLPQPSTAVAEEQPTDLSFKPQLTQNNESVDQPTDLSVPRPSSQNSEAIQSPQPSGIPAVPPSPDIVTPSTKKSVFLESLLTTTSQKIPLNSEVTIIKQNEPLDLGKLRESASPTVTCSEQTDIEPPAKKFKPISQDITLKNLLDEETSKSQDKNTPRLLELLKNDSNEADPLTQLRQLLTDRSLNVPDPMLVPKEKLSLLISHPGKEIPRLLKQRPELRLPEALAFPHLLQDPDILVITLQQLETIILKQNQTLPLKDLKSYEKKLEHREPKKKEEVLQKSSKPFNELASDIDAATTAAFNQMLWLPYLSQLEAMSCAGDPQMMKLLSSPVYPPELVHLNRLPPNINYNPVHPPQMNYNSLELSMWQEAMLQANVLRPKPHNNFLDFSPKPKLPPPPNKQSLPNFYPSGVNSFLNMPFQSNKSGMQLPLYGHTKHHPHKSVSSHFAPKQKYSHKLEDKHRQRLACNSKPFSVAKPTSEQHQKTQPIDLSSVTTPRIKVKSHPLLKHDDVPEVGSTTASVEEMQDAHKHLWHPLFGK